MSVLDEGGAIAAADVDAAGGVGESPPRPDGRLKVTGEFAFSSDLWADDMVWGATLRSPHPRARLVSVDVGPALAVPGVLAVLTHEDVPGSRRYGLEHVDQPVLAFDEVRYQGEPVAVVAADHPEVAARAASLIRVGYEVLPPLVDPEAAVLPDSARVHADRPNLLRHVPIRKGDPEAAAEVVVSGVYDVGMQDQAFLGPESGLAIPAEDGGVDLYVATQWLHVDQLQVSASLGLPPEKVRFTLAGVGGAFGGREDLSMQIHACLLALRTGRLVEIRVRNAMEEGDRMPTGQVVEGPTPVAELLRLVEGKPPAPAKPDFLPGGTANTTRGEGVVRGVGYGIGIKNVGFSGGLDDFSTARVRLELIGGRPSALVRTAAAEVGQGLVTVLAQIARTELGVAQVTIAPADTGIGSAGSTSASRQTYMTGGATKAACEAVREKLLARLDGPGLRLVGERVLDAGGEAVASLVELLADGAVEATVEWRHRPTSPLDPETGQGDAHVQYAFAAHRATVDVDVELGLVRVVEIVTAQDVGKAINPKAVEGQIHGGTAQGLGLALMEEIQVRDGLVRNPSFTDYLLPTIMDMPPMRLDVLELAAPHSPYGLRGVGEPPNISSVPAIVAAIRAATGIALTRVPVRPEHLTVERP